MNYPILFFILIFSTSAFSQIKTDTSQGLSNSKRAIMILGPQSNFQHVTFDNGSVINLNAELNSVLSDKSTTFSHKLLIAFDYMDKLGFKLVSSLTYGDYHSNFIFERR